MFISNSVSDDVCGSTAERVAVPSSRTSAVEWAEGIAGQIRARCMDTYAAAKQVDPKPPPERVDLEKIEKKSRLQKARDESEHRTTLVNGRLCCSGCGSKVSAKGAIAWLKTPCKVSRKRQICQLEFDRVTGLVRIGRRECHDSHALVFDRVTGVHICTSCGCHGRTKFRNLSRPCGKAAGRIALRMVERGLQPGNSARATEFNRKRQRLAPRG